MIISVVEDYVPPLCSHGRVAWTCENHSGGSLTKQRGPKNGQEGTPDGLMPQGQGAVIPRTTTDAGDDVSDIEEVCGESFDHDVEDIYEDSEVLQWICRRCGAESWEDKTPDESETT